MRACINAPDNDSFYECTDHCWTRTHARAHTPARPYARTRTGAQAHRRTTLLPHHAAQADEEEDTVQSRQVSNGAAHLENPAVNPITCPECPASLLRADVAEHQQAKAQRDAAADRRLAPFYHGNCILVRKDAGRSGAVTLYRIACSCVMQARRTPHSPDWNTSTLHTHLCQVSLAPSLLVTTPTLTRMMQDRALSSHVTQR
eukprot:6198028-Pleurochrysis_carterae.AAC.7